jgi:hypothetical protein
MEAVLSPALHTQAATAAVARTGLGQRRRSTHTSALPCPRNQSNTGFSSSQSVTGQKIVSSKRGVVRKDAKRGGQVRAVGTQSPTRERPSVKDAAQKYVEGLEGKLDASKLEEVAGQVASETGSEKAQISEFLKREYKAGFVTDIQSESIPRGLSEDTVRLISAKKNEPEWMLEYRLRAYRQWLKMEEPRWSDNKYPR